MEEADRHLWTLVIPNLIEYFSLKISDGHEIQMQLLGCEIVLGARQSYLIDCTEKSINYLMGFDLICLLYYTLRSV